MTTSDYLEQLVQDRDDLVDNLTEKGITGLTGDETFTELVPEILNIPSGGGVDIEDYFITKPTQISSPNQGYFFIKKMPPIDCTNISTLRFTQYLNLEEITLTNVSNFINASQMFMYCNNLKTLNVDLTFNLSTFKGMENMFANCESLTSVPKINVPNSNVTNTTSMFNNCKLLTEIDLSGITFENLANCNYMFSGCTSLQKIDIRNLDFTITNNHAHIFGNTVSSYVPADCLIIVKDATQKSWINTNFSRMTNVQTVAEYEASL